MLQRGYCVSNVCHVPLQMLHVNFVMSLIQKTDITVKITNQQSFKLLEDNALLIGIVSMGDLEENSIHVKILDI